tara:strand:- start:2836 stop:3045 length:210 start_codon:yes stop_codon:yes gene_type:complete
MGNYLLKDKIKINNNDLDKSLIQTDLIERIVYLEDKIDNLDAKIWSFESKTESNFNSVYRKLKMKEIRI